MRVSQQLHGLRPSIAGGRIRIDNRRTVLCSGLPLGLHERAVNVSDGAFALKEYVPSRIFEYFVSNYGQHKPLVVMLPDDMLGSFAFRLVAMQLCVKGFTVLLPNYKCQYLSAEREAQVTSSIEQYVSSVLGSNNSGKVVLIGHGRGGSVARALIEREGQGESEIVGAMFICDPHILGLSRVRMDAGLMWARLCGAFGEEISFSPATARRRFFSDQIDEADFTKNVFPYMTPLFAKGSNEAIEMGPEDLQIPWRAVFGREDKSLVLSGIEHPNVVYIEDGSHTPMITQPDETAKIILDFLGQF